jgi:predicted ATP-grasp superfamily ATP-dependent carboligase
MNRASILRAKEKSQLSSMIFLFRPKEGYYLTREPSSLLAVSACYLYVWTYCSGVFDNLRELSALLPIDVLLIDAHSPFALPVATCLTQTPGIRVHALAESSRFPLRVSRYCSSSRVRTGNDDAAWQEDIRKILRRTPVQVIVPLDMGGVRFTAAYRDELTSLVRLPPPPSLTAFDTVADKWHLACFLRCHGLPQPQSFLAEQSNGSPADPHALPFPILLKPREGANGAGIERFDDSEALSRRLVDLRSEAGWFLLQGYVVGEDWDCSVLCHRGTILAQTIQRPCVPGRASFGPSPGIVFQDHPAVAATVASLMAALDWSGIAHVDLRVDQSGIPRILEVNPRYWGSLLGSLAAGVNFPHLHVLNALGTDFVAPQQSPIRFVLEHRLWRPIPALNRRPIHPALEGLSLQESIWRYTIADPLPDLYSLLRRLGR